MFIQRSDADALIPVEEVRAIYKSVAEKSVALNLLTRLPDMTAKQTRLKVMDSLPVVYWQGSDTARKKLTKAKWKNKYLTAEELAVIIPISEAVLDDAEYDIWGEIKPKLEEAIANKIDAAVFLGDDKPAGFPEGLLNQAISAGHTFAPAVNQSFYSQASDAMGLVEDDGYEVTGIVGGTQIKKYFRDMTDTTGQIIVGSEIAALPRHVIRNGAWDVAKARFLVGDFKEAVIAVRQDINYKLLTEGVIQDPSSGEILYNLGQDDMVALRVTFRVAWQVPNPVSAVNPDEETRLPFAVVVPTAHKVVVSAPESQNFSTSFDVELKADVATAKIYYTDNGNTPDSSSTLYTGPIHLTGTKTIKAIAYADGNTASDVVSATYTKA